MECEFYCIRLLYHTSPALVSTVINKPHADSFIVMSFIEAQDALSGNVNDYIKTSTKELHKRLRDVEAKEAKAGPKGDRGPKGTFINYVDFLFSQELQLSIPIVILGAG